MADQKGTIMVLKVVDLQCPKCYKKIKKILCKFSQIRNQEFDEKQNTVTISVVCCSPEKIRDKLCCKGGKTIISIEIKEPEKPMPKSKKSKNSKEKENPKSNGEKPPDEKPDENPSPAPASPKQPEPVQGYRPLVYPIFGVCCGPCYEGCYHRHGRPKPCYCGCGRLAPCYDASMPKPCYCGCGRSAPCNYGDGYYGKPCSASVYYFTEENPSGCTIM